MLLQKANLLERLIREISKKTRFGVISSSRSVNNDSSFQHAIIGNFGASLLSYFILDMDITRPVKFSFIKWNTY